MDNGRRDTVFVSEKLSRDIGEANFSTFEPIEDCSSFQERFRERLKRYRPDLTQNAETWRELVSVILRAAEEKHIIISARSLLGWGPVADPQMQRDPSTSSSTEKTRILAYKICAAMDLNIEQINDFFTSVFLTKAFFVRRIRELLYYHYIVSMEDNWFTKAEAVFEKCQTDDCENPQEDVTFTNSILNELDQIEDDSDLLEFINAKRNSLQSKFIGTSARAKIVELVQKVWLLVCIERHLTEKTNDNIILGEVNYEKLLDRILGYRVHDENMPKIADIPAAVLPRQITQAFPNYVYLREIVGNGNVYCRDSSRKENYNVLQPDIIRKMLLLLALYNRYAPQEIAYEMMDKNPRLSLRDAKYRIGLCYQRGFDIGNTYDKLPENEKESFESYFYSKNRVAQGRVIKAFENVKHVKQNPDLSENIFNEFVQQTNTLLENAEFPGLYMRNAYDYMIVYCAVKKRPISALRELMRKFLTAGN